MSIRKDLANVHLQHLVDDGDTGSVLVSSGSETNSEKGTKPMPARKMGVLRNRAGLQIAEGRFKFYASKEIINPAAWQHFTRAFDSNDAAIEFVRELRDDLRVEHGSIQFRGIIVDCGLDSERFAIGVFWKIRKGVENQFFALAER